MTNNPDATLSQPNTERAVWNITEKERNFLVNVAAGMTDSKNAIVCAHHLYGAPGYILHHRQNLDANDLIYSGNPGYVSQRDMFDRLQPLFNEYRSRMVELGTFLNKIAPNPENPARYVFVSDILLMKHLEPEQYRIRYAQEVEDKALGKGSVDKNKRTIVDLVDDYDVRLIRKDVDPHWKFNVCELAFSTNAAHEPLKHNDKFILSQAESLRLVYLRQRNDLYRNISTESQIPSEKFVGCLDARELRKTQLVSFFREPNMLSKDNSTVFENDFANFFNRAASNSLYKASSDLYVFLKDIYSKERHTAYDELSKNAKTSKDTEKERDLI